MGVKRNLAGVNNNRISYFILKYRYASDKLGTKQQVNKIFKIYPLISRTYQDIDKFRIASDLTKRMSQIVENTYTNNFLPTRSKQEQIGKSLEIKKKISERIMASLIRSLTGGLDGVNNGKIYCFTDLCLGLTKILINSGLTPS